MLKTGELQNYITALDKGDTGAQRQALLSLKQFEEKEWVGASQETIHAVMEALQNLLSNGTKHPFLRKEVAIILGNMGSRAKAGISKLIELLQEGIPDSAREAAAVALGKIGPEAKVAVEQLLLLTSNRRVALAVQAIRALTIIGVVDHRVRSALVNLWIAPGHPLNHHVEVALALCKLKIEVQGLVPSLTHSVVIHQDVLVRKSAAEALGWCSAKEVDVVPALFLSALNDKIEEVRRIAENSLAQLRLTHEQAAHHCAGQLKESVHAETALRKSGALAVPALMEALRTPDREVKIKAARTLGSLGEWAAAAVPALTKVLHHKDVDTRLAAAKGLWNITKKPDDVVPVLIDLLTETLDGGEIRRRFLQTVMEALWRIGPPAHEALPALQKMTKDKNRLVSETAHCALKEIASTEPKKVAAR